MLKQLLARLGGALAAGGSTAIATYATSGGNVKASLAAGGSTAVTFLVYGAAHVAAGSSEK